MAAINPQTLVPSAPASPPLAPATGSAVPLCVDLDGTLLKTDSSWEAVLQILFRHPLRLAAVLGSCERGRAWMKKQLAKAASLPPASLPYNADVLALIAQAKSAGRKALLVTASDQLVADAVAAHLKLFDEAIGSDGVTNLRGAAKAALLVKKFGRGGFDYAGDSAQDIPVWRAARHGYAVNPAPAAARWAARRGSVTTLGAARGRWRAMAAPLWRQGQTSRPPAGLSQAAPPDISGDGPREDGAVTAAVGAPGGNQPRPRPKLGVAVPLANEEATIHGFLDRVLAHLQSQDRVYCVLDNVCRDRTRDIVSERSARDRRVVLVWSPLNRCVVDAYFAGYRAAYNDGCQWILEMDGGFSHLPEQIPAFLAGMEQGYDFVGGSRYLRGGRHKSPWNRVLISRGGTVLARRLLHAQMTDMTSGFECFSRRAMGMVLQAGVASKANFFQTEIRWMMHRLRWLEVPISYENPNVHIGRSSIREAFRILWDLRRAEKQKRRIA